jgi:hypothetical protein
MGNSLSDSTNVPTADRSVNRELARLNPPWPWGAPQP